jgi:adenosylcobinamide-GDP ribazoletransferase
VTGGLHEDGLADTSDALGGASSPDKIAAILKDSRIGTYGTCALVVSIAGRAALLARLDSDAVWALPLVGAVARVGPIWQIATMPYVTAPEQAKSAGATRGRALQACVGTACTLALATAMTWHLHLAVQRIEGLFVAVTVVTAITAWRYARRLGGITGDFLGATEQLCELVAFAVLAWR